MLQKTISTLILIMLATISIKAEELNKLTDRLRKVYYEDYEDNDLIPVYIVLQKQYCPTTLYNEVRELPKTERRQRTIATLKAFSSETQAGVRFLLDEFSKNGEVSRIRYLWIANIIGLESSRKTLTVLGNHPDVKYIDYDPKTYLLNDTFTQDDEWNYSNNFDNVETKHNNSAKTNQGRDAMSTDTTRSPQPQWHIEQINADKVWVSGYKGDGVVIAVLDTGINYFHTDISNNLWEHPEFPYYGYNFPGDNIFTFDGHGHGTYCAGLAAGDGQSGRITGIAPDSRIMALKVLDDAGRGKAQWLWDAMQFAVEYEADIMSVSLGWVQPPDELRKVFRDIALNVLSVGIIMSKSAGNLWQLRSRYPIPYNISVPSDCPPPYLSPDQTLLGGVSSVLCIGATDDEDVIALFSSRGPVTWQEVEGYNDYPYNPGMGLLRPDVCAPGVDVLSLSNILPSGYRLAGGTSASAPIVAGTLALMLSRNQTLSPEDLGRIIEESAVRLSETKDNTYGSGRVDAYTAVFACPYIALKGVLYGDDNNNIPEYNETVSISITLEMSNLNGFFNGHLTSNDQYINILNNYTGFNVSETDSIVTVDNAFSVEIACNAPDGHNADFSLLLMENAEIIGRESFSMKITAPYLTSNYAYVYDPLPGGNDNGMIDPGEELLLFLPLSNKGGSLSPPVFVSLTSETALLSINEISENYFRSIKSGETLFPAVSVSISEEATSHTPLYIGYSYQTGSYSFEGRIQLDVGQSLNARIGYGDKSTENNEPSPVNIYFNSLRSQALYTAEELKKAGVHGALPINQLGYFVTATPEYPLPNFTIRMKHTTADELNEHETVPFETVYHTDQYLPADGQWDMLALTPPFVWNGKDNILVDTAFSPVVDWSRTGQIKIFDAVNGFRFTRADSPDQTNEITTTKADYKPQITMVFYIDSDALKKRPQNLYAEIADNQVELMWEAPEAARSSGEILNIIGYNIYRNGFRINEEPVGEGYYTDLDLLPGKNYFYYVTSLFDNQESIPSNIHYLQVRAATPRLSHQPGEYHNAIIVTIGTATPDAAIYYTDDSSNPDVNSFIYDPNNPIKISRTTTLRAVAMREDLLPSDVAEATYHILSIDDDYVSYPIITALNKVYPNPFNPKTNISFSIAEGGDVSIEVFNIKGQIIKKIIDDYKNPGHYQIIWNGRDESNREVSSGVYFLRLKTEKYNKIVKLLLLK